MKRISFWLALGVLALAALSLGSGVQAATPCADLLVESVASVPAPPAIGQPSTVAITVRNAGTCAAGGFGVQWRPDLLATPQPTIPVAGLDAGATTAVNVPYTFARTGIFLSFATVDVANAVAETNEGNNVVPKAFTPSLGVDLVVSDVSIDTATPAPGQPFTVSVTVANQGPNPAGAFRVDWSPGFGLPTIQRQVAALAGGASTTVTIPYAYLNPGTFDSLAVADAGSSVPETNEFNNARSSRAIVTAILPDLVVTDASTDPPAPFANSAVTATVTVRNDGVAAAGSFAVRWQPWLLGDPVTTQIDGLAPGASATVSLSFVFTYPGTFDGTVTVDSGNAVSELNEGNNTRATHLTISAPNLGARKVATGGFGDYQNSYSWSMEWFKGKLYAGTARSVHCVEAQTLNFYYPGQGYYNGYLDGLPEANCPVDPYDLDLRAEIWQYTPETGLWKRVYQSPVIPNPREPGKVVGRDIGFRGMVVHTDSNGVQALYVGGVTSDEYIPELAAQYPPRVLRSVDGETFTPLPTGPGLIHNTLGEQRPIGFRALASFNGRLFATASGGLTGDGVLFEIKDPAGPNPQFVQVSPDTIHIYELEAFNGTLYLGSGTPNHGYSVFKVTDMSTVPFKVTQVVPEGAGRGTEITSVVSMQVFKNRLYVGANGWGAGSIPAAEEIRINPDDSWDVVAGKVRTLPDGTTKAPISGLGDGFGNFFTAHMWRAETHNGAMYIGTNDASSAFKAVPALGPVLQAEWGFDVWGTCDGQYWWQVTRNAFGDGAWNFGARSLVSTPFGLFVGSTNHVEGTSVWLGDASPCGAAGGGGGTGQFGLAQRGSSTSSSGAKIDAAPAPRRLVAAGAPCGTGLRWDAAPDARRYRILRAEYRPYTVNMNVPPRLTGDGFSPDAMAVPATPGSPHTRSVAIPVASAYVEIGTTASTTYVDRTAKKGTHYNYEIVAIGPNGAPSQPSNVATVSTQTASAANFSALEAAVGRLDGNRQKLLALTTASRTAWSASGPSASLKLLGKLRTALAAHKGAASAVADARDAIFRLERSASLNSRCRA